MAARQQWWLLLHMITLVGVGPLPAAPTEGGGSEGDDGNVPNDGDANDGDGGAPGEAQPGPGGWAFQVPLRGGQLEGPGVEKLPQCGR